MLFCHLLFGASVKIMSYFCRIKLLTMLTRTRFNFYFFPDLTTSLISLLLSMFERYNFSHVVAPTILLILHAQDDLWGSVVSGYHVGGHHEVGAGRPRQAEVQDLQSTIRLHYYVTRLQILRGHKIYKSTGKYANEKIVQANSVARVGCLKL